MIVIYFPGTYSMVYKNFFNERRKPTPHAKGVIDINN